MNMQIVPVVLLTGALAVLTLGHVSLADDSSAPTPIALVGCAHIHTPGFVKTLKKRTDIKVKFVWDHDAERAKKDAAELGIRSSMTCRRSGRTHRSRRWSSARRRTGTRRW